MGILKLDGNKKGNFRQNSAREAYYLELLKYDGKPAADFLKDMDANPAKLPKSGRPEKASGWLSWFKDEGYVTELAEATPAPKKGKK